MSNKLSQLIGLENTVATLDNSTAESDPAAIGYIEQLKLEVKIWKNKYIR